MKVAQIFLFLNFIKKSFIYSSIRSVIVFNETHDDEGDGGDQDDVESEVGDEDDDEGVGGDQEGTGWSRAAPRD